MGLDIIVEGADFREQGSFDIPVTNGLLGWYFPGGTLASALRNFAPARDNLISVGAPVVSDDYVGLKSQTSYLDAGYPDPAEGTYIVVGRSVASGTGLTTRFGYMGKTGPGQTGVDFTHSSTTQVRVRAYHNPGSGATSINTDLTVSPTSWLCLEADFGADGQAVRSLTDGTEAIGAYTGARITGGNIALGGALASAGFASGEGQIAFAGVWSRRLNGAERNAVYVTLKAYFADIGISI